MIRHVASIAEIVEDFEAALDHYHNVLGLEVEIFAKGEYAVAKVPGVLHFGIWQRRAAARQTLGNEAQAHDIPLGFTVGFEVDDVDEAAARLEEGGCRPAQPPQDEPWGQRTARYFSPSGALCEVAQTSWARRLARDVEAEKEEKDE